MRIPQQNQDQLLLHCPTIGQIDLNTNCRHRIIPILRALQHLHSQTEVLDAIVALIQRDVLGDADPNQGRDGMTYWQILVLAAVKAGCNFTYDELQDLAENSHEELFVLARYVTLYYSTDRIAYLLGGEWLSDLRADLVGHQII